MIQGKKEFYEIPASDKQKICSKGVTSIVDVVVENTQYFYVLNADIDEEEHAYLLIPSSDKATSDWFLKIYFDISHNE
jgi:hypothetical protein